MITSDWAEQTPQTVFLQGLNLDVVWDNIVKSIGGIDVAEGNTLVEQIKENAEREKILKQIEVLQQRMAREKQPRRKRELFEEIQRLKATIP